MNNSLPLPSERVPPVPNCPAPSASVTFWFWRPPHFSDKLLTSSLDIHRIARTGDIGITQTLQPLVLQSLHHQWGRSSHLCCWSRSQWTSTPQLEPLLSQNAEQDRATQQSNCLPFTRTYSALLRWFINFMRFVVRKHWNKRTIRRPFNHWLFTFISLPFYPFISTSPGQNPGKKTEIVWNQ